jgi:hypothetical protein
VSYQQYSDYMKSLFSPNDTVCFAFIREGHPTRHVFSPAEDAFTEKCFADLHDANKVYNVYVGMNPFKSELIGQNTGRTKDNVAKVKRLYAEVDTDGKAVFDKILSSSVTPPPNVVLESSPGKFQFIWNVDGLTQETAEPLLKAIAQQFNTDPAVAEIARVLRVPGLRNHKYVDAPEVKIVGDTDCCFYDRIDFQIQVKPERKDSPSIDGDKIPHGSHDKELTRIAGKLRQAGAEEEAIYTALVEVCEKRCENYGGDYKEMCRKIAHSVCNYPIRQNTDLALNQVPVASLATTPEQFTDEMLDREFPAYDGKDVGPIPMLIEDFLPKGANFFGSLSGVGKTWLGLSVTKALTTGRPLFGVFAVKEPVAVLYLIPEASNATFKLRAKHMNLTKDKKLFRYRTISQGATLPLKDPLTVAMIKNLRDNGRRQVLVIVDTAVRFLQAEDENASTQNSRPPWHR